jgi:demethylmenaquinone methyltransferase/2-methoxy-6-polyprenyl-1,4-benzoquinol methylase
MSCPAIGRLFTGPTAPGAEGPYRYLPTSVGNFPSPQELLALMRTVGYDDCSWQPYTFGIAGLYTCARSNS